MKNEKKPNSGIPLVIIVLVLAGVIVGAWYLYNSSKSTGTTTANRNSNAASNAARNSQVPANAPVGAQPPQMLGSPTATVTLEEFADFQCGSCATANPILKQIQSQYGSKIKFIFRHFPLTMHDKAYDAAVAAEAAGMQGKFWDMQNLLFTNQTAWASNPNYRQMFSEYAGRLGLDVAKFQNDAAGIQAKSRVDRDLERGRALNVSSTPTLYINGKSVPYQEMNASSLKLLIDAEFQTSAPPVQGPSAPAANSSNAASNSK